MLNLVMGFNVKLSCCILSKMCLCVYTHTQVWRREGLLECGWRADNVCVITYSFDLNISPKMSCGVLECDIVM